MPSSGHIERSSPSVTVVITTHNRARLVVEAVESVLAQTVTDFELIVIDDGSTDDTALLLDPYKDRLSYHRQENSGPSSARNRGIEIAGGSLIAFLDSDDLWHPEKLLRQVDYLQLHPEFPLCYTDEIWIRGGRRVNQGKRHRKYGGWIFDKILPLCLISPSSVLLRRSLFDDVGMFDESLPACEDYDLWIRIACRYPVGFIPQPLIVKRGGRSDQLSKIVGSLDKYRVKSLLKLLESDALDDEQRHLALLHLREKSRVYGMGCVKRGRVEEGNYYLGLADGIS